MPVYLSMKSSETIIALLALLILTGSCADQPSLRSDQPPSVSGSSKVVASSPPVQADYNDPARRAVDPDSSIDAHRDNAITRAVEKVSPAVVSITVTEVVQGRARRFNQDLRRFFIAPTEREFSSMGSGFIISEDGMIVTNEHVADADAKKIVVSLTDGSQYEAKIIGTDPPADLALLKIDADRTFPFIRFGDSDEVKVGEWSLAIGNPFGLFKEGQPSVTVGVVSALHRDFRPNPDKPRAYLDMIQTDAAINSGNSGGPLVDSRGRVIGVNTFIFTGGTSGGFVGLGFAIPSNRVQKIIRQLAETGEVRPGYDLGIETTPMTYNMAVNNNLPAIVGLFVTSVNRDGPGYKSGIVPGDILVKIGDERIQSQMHAQALFREYESGDSLSIQLVRNNEVYETKIMLRTKVTDN